MREPGTNGAQLLPGRTGRERLGIEPSLDNDCLEKIAWKDCIRIRPACQDVSSSLVHTV